MELVRDFYTDRAGRLALLICAPVLVYGGGAVMFWFHAVYLGEGGPSIPNWVHWLLDSTVGMVALTPVIAVILPLARWIGRPRPARGAAARAGPTTAGRHFAATGRVRPWRIGLVGGFVLAVVVAPAPLMHDRVVGRGTWLADQATRLWGDGRAPVGEAQEVPVWVEMAQQVAAGIPTYVLLMVLALSIAHALVPLNAPGQPDRSWAPTVTGRDGSAAHSDHEPG